MREMIHGLLLSFLLLIQCQTEFKVLCDDKCTGVYINGVLQDNSVINLLSINNTVQTLSLNLNLGDLITLETTNTNLAMGISDLGRIK